MDLVRLVNGVQIAARLDGRDSARWVVLSNSLAADLHSWDDQIPLLTERFRVLRYDTRGHGGSSAPEGPSTFADLTGDVLGLMDHYGVGEATFIGLSMGGMTGLGLAIDYPERINRLICCDARADAIPAFIDNWTARIGSVKEAGGMTPIAAFNKTRWFTPGFAASQPEVVRKAMNMVLSTSVCGYIGCAQALQTLDYKRHLGRIACPTLFVCGAQDAASPATVMQAMAELTPGAAFRRVDPGAHLCNMENPVGFNAVIGDWLSH